MELLFFFEGRFFSVSLQEKKINLCLPAKRQSVSVEQACGNPSDHI